MLQSLSIDRGIAEGVQYGYKMDKIKFGKWLKTQREARGMNRSELSRATIRAGKAFVSPQQISRAEAGLRGLEAKSIEGIALGLDLPVAVVWEAAGYLPPTKETNRLIQEINLVLDRLPPHKQVEILEIARLEESLEERRGRAAKNKRGAAAAGQ